MVLRNWMFLLWIRTSDGQLDVISYITFSIYFIRQFKTYLQTWWKNPFNYFHMMWQPSDRNSMSLIYMRNFWFLCYAAYSELCNSCLQPKWKERIPLFAQHFSAFRAMLTSFQYSPKNQLAGYFQRVKSYLIVSLNSWLLKFGMSSIDVSCSHKSILYIFFMGDRSEEG